MANLAKLDFAALDITRNNYLTWVLDTKIHLEAANLRDTIREESSSSSQERAKAMIFIHRYLDEALKSEYLTIEDLLAFWKALRNRYNHQTTMILPRACYDWTHLRIQDFKSVAEYNYALFRITSQMKLCGILLLRRCYWKILSTHFMPLTCSCSSSIKREASLNTTS
ncbi:uncharacterized protein [Malus domestica]|uniref:uncharacterized protein n=1 Tax=Malus domestica TaxID=3750 RepID=UPI0039757300